MQEGVTLGIDIGGTGIKGALVDCEKGTLITERYRLETPQPANPESVAYTVNELVQHFNWKGQIGCGFPAIVKHGVANSAANIDDAWIGINAESLLSKITSCPVVVLNDADAAGMAELKHGVGRSREGVVMMITIGSGLGSAMFVNGNLVPNTELGHLYLKGQEQVAEKYCSNNARKKEGLGWSEWAARFSQYLCHLERLYTPDLFILGGGGSKKFEKFSDYLDVSTKVLPAKLLNNAGIIGAAMYAHEVDSGLVKG